MPIYEYRCTACQHKLEALQKFSDAPMLTCPQCAKDTLTKLVSAAGFQLKGSGWYQTDFRGGSKPPTALPVKSDAASTEGKSGGEAKSSDAAPAAASETPAAKTESKPAPAGGTSAPT